MKIKKKKQHNKRNFPLLFTSIFVIGYVIFFTSKIWFPNGNEYIQATKFYEIKKYNTYDIYISKWDYSPDQNIMELTIELNNSDVLDKKLTFEAVTRSRKKTTTVTVQPMVKDSNFIIFQLQDIPKNWEEISFRIGEEKELSPLKLYSNVNTIQKVKKIEKQSEQSYRVSRFENMQKRNIEIMAIQEKEVAKLSKNIAQMKGKINELKKELEYETSEEKEVTENKIKKAEGEIQADQKTMDQINKKISELIDKNAKVEEQISAIK